MVESRELYLNSSKGKVWMPVIEHMLCGAGAGAEHAARGVLARSPGVESACASEIMRLCDGWGRVPEEGLRRSVVLAFPLESTLAALPGQLYTVIRSTVGTNPIFHAVIMTDNDYGAFARNPYAVVNENVFIDDYLPGLILEQRQIDTSTLGPLVSPLPSNADVGFVDEAVRQVIVSKTLLLPLEGPEVRSERILALVIASLPLVIKRRLRFASWTTSDVNNYTLAATYTQGGRFEVWQRLLMTRVTGKLPAATEQYIADIRQRLGAGDLMGLDSVSLQGNVELPASKPRSTVKKAGHRSATIVQRTPPVSTMVPRNSPMAAVTGRGGRAPGRSAGRNSDGPRLIRTRRVVTRRRSNRVGKAIVIMLAAVMFLLGGAYMLGHNEAITDLVEGIFERDAEVLPPGMSVLGIVDVASL